MNLLFGLALAAAGALADPFNISAWETLSNGGVITHRIWWGDGKAYTGPVVPPEVKQAFNITSPGDRSNLVYVVVDEARSPAGTPALPNPTFLVVNTAANASDPLFFVHSAVELTSDDLYLWLGFEGFLLVEKDNNLYQPGTGGYYLIPTSVNGTYTVRYYSNTATAQAQGGKAVSMSSRTI